MEEVNRVGREIDFVAAFCHDEFGCLGGRVDFGKGVKGVLDIENHNLLYFFRFIMQGLYYLGD